MADHEEPYVGRRVRKIEDPKLLLGRGRFVDDFEPSQTLHVAFLRSPMAHGRIRTIDVAPAKAQPGVVGAFTASDMDAVCSGWRGLLNWPGLVAGEQRPLARDTVQYVGEPIALVVAGSRAQAEDAVELIEIEFEELPAVVDPVSALEPDAVLVHEELESNLAFEMDFGEGDVDAAFDAAHEVVTVSMSTGRHTAVSLEPRGLLVDYDAVGGELTIRISTQAPHLLQVVFAEFLGLPDNAVRILTEDVGGAFGMKAYLYPDEMAVVIAGYLLGRPLKWIGDRYESFQADTHSRDHRVEASLAVSQDGEILGLRAQVLSDGGAFSMYPRTMVVEGVQACSIMPGPYRVRAYHGHLRIAITNKSPLALYRAVGHPVAILVMETLMDEVARQLGLSPVELRRRNIIRQDELPYTSVTGWQYDSGSHQEALELLIEKLELGNLDQRKQQAQERGRLLGLGIICFVELTAPGANFYAARGAQVTAHDQVEVRVQPDGSVLALLGTAGQGQGLNTTAAQVVADHLGVRMEDVRVIAGDTHAGPHGTDIWGSRSGVVSSAAAAQAATKVRERLLAIAGHLLEADAGDLEVTQGSVRVKGAPQMAVPVAEVARMAHWGTHELPDGLELSLAATGEYDPPRNGTFNNSAHAALVEVDPGTGLVQVLDYVVVEDSGVLINPDVVDGQIRGGVAQGLGGALLEHLVYDDAGQLVTSTMLDYAIPSALDLPDIRIHHLETPAPSTALGTKGVGEAGTAGAPAAINTAVNDALAQVGARVWHQPLTPERLLAAIHDSEGGQ